ncbi:hypothetical protein LIER_05984 [Lithospermum erythrorhizon]|uniref:CASP-like protein n=1 Tax=Lithospermum erythrorhizon TaxID=34254 RepID=A0AAV3P463_LITER
MAMPNDGNVETGSPKAPQTTTMPPSGAGDVESQATTVQGLGVANIIQRWKRHDLVKKGSLALRGSSLVFSLLAFIIMASNKHGDWKNFDNYEELRYVLAIAIISTIYTGCQAFLTFNEFTSGKEYISQHYKTRLDFIGDQLLAYLLISAASSAIPLTNRMRSGADNIFTDSSATAISMEFFAFFALAGSALISGYNLSNKSYI